MPSVDAAVPSGRPEKYIDDEQLIIQALNPDGSPRRPMNAFMIFARRRRPQVSAANQTMRTGEISKILSREWATMPMSEKEFYLEQAKRLKDIFNAKYPDYVYRRRPNNSRRKPKGSGTLCPVDPSDDSSDTATAGTHGYDWPSPPDLADELPSVQPTPPSRPSAYPPPAADYYTPRLHDARAVDLLSHPSSHAHSPSTSPSTTYSPYVYPPPSAADSVQSPWSTAHHPNTHHRTSSAHATSWPPPAQPPASAYALRAQRSLTALQTRPPPAPANALPPPPRPWSAATSAGSPSSAGSAYGGGGGGGGSGSSGTGQGTLHPAHPTPPPYFEAHHSPATPYTAPPTHHHHHHHHDAFFSSASSYTSAPPPPPPAYPGSSSYASGMHAHEYAPRVLAPPHPYASTGAGAAGLLAPKSGVLWERGK
ncbi:hypothetical protein K488DRAFT_69556 [Vararia minispora EC-137]|uniref:Uncharacterized protein n=1 Tax=Vararia minispora EC-137 TaxID=1314806 RepID=A0ACB8QQC6_9AGAM|nr:hypothetical protein K488DRAFT_69556 [Vararia minispora EC-137]